MGFVKCKAVVSDTKSRGRREGALGLAWTHEANNERPEEFSKRKLEDS